jgi:hypothetical protein
MIIQKPSILVFSKEYVYKLKPVYAIRYWCKYNAPQKWWNPYCVVRYWIKVFTVHILICWSVSKFAFQYTVFADEYYFIYFLYYFSISIMDEKTFLISTLLRKGAEIGLSKWKYIIGVRTKNRTNGRSFNPQQV